MPTIALRPSLKILFSKIDDVFDNFLNTVMLLLYCTSCQPRQLPPQLAAHSPDVRLEQHGLSHVGYPTEDHQAAVSHRDHGVLAEHDRFAPERQGTPCHVQSTVKTVLPGFGNGWLKYCPTPILEYFYTTL